MYQPIATLPGSDLHRTAVAIYQRHYTDDSGRCPACGGQAPCRARQHASTVIAAANEDPHWYDRRVPDNLASAIGLAPPPASQQHDERSSQPFVAFAQSWPPVPLSTKPKPSVDTPGVTGWPVGGVGRRADVPFVDHER